MRIDAINQMPPVLGGMMETARPLVQPQAGRDTVNLSALAAGEMDDAATAHTAGMIVTNAADALSVHKGIDPERAMRLVGLLD